MIAVLFYFIGLSIVATVTSFVFADKYKKKSIALDKLLKEVEADEHDEYLLKRAKADAQICVNTALAQHYDNCHDEDKHFM